MKIIKVDKMKDKKFIVTQRSYDSISPCYELSYGNEEEHNLVFLSIKAPRVGKENMQDIADCLNKKFNVTLKEEVK